jgi:hypothetical protein
MIRLDTMVRLQVAAVFYSRPSGARSQRLPQQRNGLDGRARFHIDLGANFTEIFLRVLSEMESRYLLSYEPTGVPLEGWHGLEVELKAGDADGIRTRPGYLVRTSH